MAGLRMISSDWDDDIRDCCHLSLLLDEMYK